MLSVLKRLALGLLLIALSSGVLLYSDRAQRKGSGGALPQVALIQYSSQPVLEEGMEGILAGLAANGFVNRKTVRLRQYNAEGDLATMNSIAREVVDGPADLIVSVSTPALQAIANVNRAGKKHHVFGLVADPAASGVGIGRDKPDEHPKWLTGYGTPLPVADCFKLARRCFPGLKTVGVAWNPGETNARVFTAQARAACRDQGLTLLEATVDNSSAVGEAANSLVSRGAQALWVGGDNAVLMALDSVIGAGKRARIPVFTVTPGKPDRGTLFDLGSDFFELGRVTGDLAAQVLRGTDPATIPIRSEASRKLQVNTTAQEGLKEPWRIPEDAIAEAAVVVDASGIHQKAAAAGTAVPKPPPGRTFKIGVVYFGPDPGTDQCLNGLFAGLKELGFEQGRNLEVRRQHAQGEIANIPGILQSFDNQGLDAIVPMSTPCVTASCSTVRNTPVVFTYCYDPIAAGGGKSFTDHLPNVTGVGSFPPVEDMVDVIQELVPGVRTVGTLYNSSEANSRKVVSVGRDLFRKRGIRLEEVTITGSAEVFQGAQAVANRKVQAFWLPGDNTAIQAFSGIVKVTTDARLPLIISDPEFVEQGALAGVGVGFYQSGFATAKPLARVLLGTSPADIPIENVAVKSVVLNHAVARRLGITFPPALVKQAAEKQ